MLHCWVPLNDTDSRITCGLQLIILQLQLHNNKQYLFNTHEQLENSGWVRTKGFSGPKRHFTIKSYLFIWPCLWKNSKKYYDKFVNHWQSQKILCQWIIVSLCICYTYSSLTKQPTFHHVTVTSLVSLQIMSEKQAQKFHTDDTSLSRPG